MTATYSVLPDLAADRRHIPINLIQPLPPLMAYGTHEEWTTDAGEARSRTQSSHSRQISKCFSSRSRQLSTAVGRKSAGRVDVAV